jgi:hypothetical protein
MEWISLYGGFTPNLSGCAYANPPYPYPTTSTDFGNIKSKTQTYGGQTYKGSVIAYFDKYFSSSGTGSSKNTCQITSPLKCCKEWDTNGDGVPDNYYNCQQGSDLAAALSNVIAQVTAQTASSSAVATLSQQTGEGDEIIRGLYQAVPPSSDSTNVGKLLWWGRLEAYWPDNNGNYAFELYGPTTSYKYMMCKDMLGAVDLGIQKLMPGSTTLYEYQDSNATPTTGLTTYNTSNDTQFLENLGIGLIITHILGRWTP